MGVPKRRVSHARQGDRRAHLALTLPQLEECPHCHQPKRAHRVDRDPYATARRGAGRGGLVVHGVRTRTARCPWGA